MTRAQVDVVGSKSESIKSIIGTVSPSKAIA